MRVSTKELRAVTNLLLDHLESTSQSEFDIEEDYYWEAEQGQLYNPYQEPSRLQLGQLSDDWSDLVSILSGESPPIGTALVWLAAVLRRVGTLTVG